jgi:hypothetical protein
LRGARESLGLQFLRRNSDLQPAEQFLLVFHLYPELLEEHARLCR